MVKEQGYDEVEKPYLTRQTTTTKTAGYRLRQLHTLRVRTEISELEFTSAIVLLVALHM